MKVLMFGWEFPPHISGGLGTACFGLTQGLASHGVEVLFVVPRAFGDEDTRFVSIVGANQIELTSSIAEAGSRAPGPRARKTKRGTSVSVEDEATAKAFSLIELLAIESPLTPYLTDVEYLTRLSEVDGEGGGEGGPWSPERRSELLASLDDILRVPRTTPRGPSPAAEVVRKLLKHGPLPFTGGYGPNLMAEVARFALVAAEIPRTRSFDVVHAHDWMTLPAGLAAARVAGKPLSTPASTTAAGRT